MIDKEKGPANEAQSKPTNNTIITDNPFDSNAHASETPDYPYPYFVDQNSLFMEIHHRTGTSLRKLCNFVPFMLEEQLIDDGSKTIRHFVIGAIHESGVSLPPVRVNAIDFSSMNWIHASWGSQCNIEPARSAKEHIRYATQCTSKQILVKTTYMYLGWKKINLYWKYLIQGNGLDVSLPGKLSSYQFTTGDSQESITASLNCALLYALPQAISYPLLAYVYLSPLLEFLRQAGFEPKVLLALVGRSGSKKSSIAALFLSHFGSFTNTTLPMTFRDTANSIVENAVLLKDTLAVVDDFHPSTRQEELQMTSIAQILVRAYGDRAGRNRLRSDSSLLYSRPPKGNLIYTGEQMPDLSESGLARCLKLEISSSDVRLDVLSSLQNNASSGLLQSAMKCYTDWIAQLLQKSEVAFVDSLRTQFLDYRTHFTHFLEESGMQYHARLPENVAFLAVGINMLQQFAVAEGIVDPERSVLLTDVALPIFDDLAIRQCSSHADDNPTVKFISKLQSLLDSGRLYVQPRSNAQMPVQQGFIGYEDSEFFYLITDIAHSSVKKLCDEQGEHFSLSVNELLRRLADEGYLKSDGNKNTSLLKIGGSAKRLLWLYKERLLSKNGVTGVTNPSNPGNPVSQG